MSKNFYTNIDLKQNELRNAVLENLDTEPADPKIGQYFYNTVTQKQGIWNGSYWSYGNDTVYENPLTFSTGLARSVDTIYNTLATGSAGGQTVIGGVNTGGTLSLSSTLHATKGKILMGTSAYDEATNRLGIGTVTPDYPLSVTGAINAQEDQSATDVAYRINGTGVIGKTTAGNFPLNAGYTRFIGQGMVFSAKNDSTIQMAIMSGTGNVGIGTNDAQAKLHVYGDPSSVTAILRASATTPGNILEFQNGSGVIQAVVYTGGQYQGAVGTASTPAFSFYGYSNNGIFKPSGDTLGFSTASSERMRIGSTGNVGIGTTTPSEKLNVSGNVNFDTTTFRIRAIPNAAQTNRGFYLSPADYNGESLIGAYGNIGGGLAIGGINTGNGNTTAKMFFDPGYGNIIFSTGTTTPAEAMRINSSGNVGIGTTSPLTSLDVTSSGVNGIMLGQDTSTATASGRLFFKNSTSVFAQEASTNTFLFNFGATIGNSTGTTVMSYNTSGNVGIGTVTPNATSRLDVYDGVAGNGLRVTRSSVISQFIELIPNYLTESVLLSAGGNNKPFVIANSGAFPIHFATGGNAIANTKVTIDANGRMGIGTGVTAITSLLDIQSGGVGVITLSSARLTNANADQLGGFWNFYTNVAVASDFFGQFGYKFEGGVTDAKKQFQIYIADASNPKMVVDGAGNVGIGTIIPINPDSGRILLLQDSVGYPTIQVKSTLATSGSAFIASNDSSKYLKFNTFGSTNGLGALFGVATANNSFMYSSNKLSLGTMGVYDLTLGTNNTARMTINSDGYVSVNTTSIIGQFGVVSGGTSRIVSVFRGVSLQSANLTEWQNNSGIKMASVNATGEIYLETSGKSFGNNAGSFNLDAYSTSIDTTVTVKNSHGSYVANLVVEGSISAGSVIRLKGYTVATLPAGIIGDTAYVTDALAPTYGNTVVGGGAIAVKVWYNGANWIVE